MTNLPKRKPIRIENYDYSTPGAYFITVCAANREKTFWNSVGADIMRPQILGKNSKVTASNEKVTTKSCRLVL